VKFGIALTEGEGVNEEEDKEGHGEIEDEN